MPLSTQTSSCCSLRASSRGVIPPSWVYPASNFPSAPHCCRDTRTKPPCWAVTPPEPEVGQHHRSSPLQHFHLMVRETVSRQPARPGGHGDTPRSRAEASTAQHRDGPCQPQPSVKKQLLLCPWTDPVRWLQHLQKLRVLSALCSGPCPASPSCSCCSSTAALGRNRGFGSLGAQPCTPLCCSQENPRAAAGCALRSGALSELVPSQLEAVAL